MSTASMFKWRRLRRECRPIAGDVETRSSIKDANVHFNMIFLLQAGAFFGSLGSAPMAGMSSLA